MEVSNPRDDGAERNLGGASVPLSTVIPWVGNFHLEQNPIYDSYNTCSENKGADQLCSYCTSDLRLCFAYAVCWFSDVGLIYM